MTTNSPSRFSGPQAEKAGLLLHHLLNQSLSGLDFCILWQELSSEPDFPQPVRELVQEFLETADLGALDRALALLPEPETATLPPLERVESVVSQEGWTVSSTRIRDISRADFTCQSCGFSITLSQEHEANTEMRLPYDNFACPVCSDPFNPDQGRTGFRTNKRA